MAKWKEGYNHALLIKKMEKTRQVNDDGQVIFKGNDIILVPPQIEAVIELNKEISQDEKKEIIWHGIRTAGRQGTLTSNSVLREVKKLEGKALSKKIDKFVLVSKISVNPTKHKLARMQINGCTITFSKRLSKNYVSKIDRSPFVSYQLYQISEMTKNYTSLKVSAHAKGMYGGAEKTLKVLKYYCGLLNYAINYGSRSYSIGDNHFKPINKIRLSPVHTLHLASGELVSNDICWLEDEYLEAPKSYTNNSLDDFDRIMNNLKNYHYWVRKGILKKKIEDAISLYNDAFNSYSYDTTFVRLWAILELLTDTGRSNYDITVRRTAFIFEEADIAKNHLNILRDIRNCTVHRGTMYGRKDIFIYDLKMYVERLIRFMIWASNKYETPEEIKQLLDCNPDKTKIDQKLKILSRAKKMDKFKAY